jgi:UDP-N-acetylmuramoylalanine-D-glutamate ligase
VELGRATVRFRDAERKYKVAREAVIEAVVAALRDGVEPAEVVELSPFSASFVRATARKHEVPPARVGVKPRKPRT